MTEPMKDPRYKMLQSELGKLNAQMGALINVISPKPFVMDIFPLAKAAIFALTRVDCIGADLVQISTDGDLTNVSYQIVHLDGSTSVEMEAAESPHCLGPINAVLVNNDTAEAGVNIRVARYQASQAALSAILHGTPAAINVAAGGRMFYGEQVEYVVGADDYFEDDEPLNAVLPTHFFYGAPLVTNILIHTIKYQFTPTAAETYQLYLLEGATAEAEQQEAEVIFDSGALQAAGVPYVWVAGGAPAELPVMARLTAAGLIWFKIDWTGAPGNTYGYIRVYGVVLA